MDPDRFLYDLGLLLTILAIYVLSEIAALYLAKWVERLAGKRYA
jgi:hypothetical protein